MKPKCHNIFHHPSCYLYWWLNEWRSNYWYWWGADNEKEKNAAVEYKFKRSMYDKEIRK